MDLIVVVFRGIQFFDIDDWCIDLDILWFGFSGVGCVYVGFMKVLGFQKVKNNVGWFKEIEMVLGKFIFVYYIIR